jgi:protein SHQ1
LIEDGREKAVYDHESGVVTMMLPKAVTGQHFEDLDMLTKLMQKKPNNTPTKPMIEVLDSSLTGGEQTPSELLKSSGREIDFEWDQTLPSDHVC